MDMVKTRKQGNAVMVTLASKYGVPAGKTYYISNEDDGTILLIPKIEDYFLTAKKHEFVDSNEELAKKNRVESGGLDEFS